jgi:hypothetical protein
MVAMSVSTIIQFVTHVGETLLISGSTKKLSMLKLGAYKMFYSGYEYQQATLGLIVLSYIDLNY